MITNNTYDALENLLLGDANLVKISNLSNKYSDKVSVAFSINEYDNTINMVLTRAEYNDDLGMPVSKNKMFKLDPENDDVFCDIPENHVLATINYILEQLQDKLNECYSIPPIGTTKLKNSNALEFCE